VLRDGAGVELAIYSERSSLGWAPLRSGFGQPILTPVCLSPGSIIWYRPMGVISLAGKLTRGRLVESNGSLLCTRFMTNVTCGLTAKKPCSAPCPTLLIEYGTTLLSL